MSPATTKIDHMIAAIRRGWLGREASWRLAATLAGLLLWLLLMVLADNWTMLSAGQLLVGWALLLLATGVWVGFAVYRLTVGKPGPEQLARLYESRTADHRNRLINAVQFLHDPHRVADPMAMAAVLENAARLDASTAARAIDRRLVRRGFATVGVCVALLAGYWVWKPAYVANGIDRLLHPLSPPPHLLATDIAVTPGNVELIEGQPLLIEAVLDRNVPATCQIEYRVENLPWVREAMTAKDSSSFIFRGFAAVAHPLSYRIHAGRSTSPTYRVRVRRRPQVELLQVSVTPPAYVGTEPQALRPNVGDVSSLAGSTVHVALTASRPLSKGQIELTDGKTVSLELDSQNPRQAIASFTLNQSGSYAIGLVDTDDLANVNPPRYTLTAEPDQPPVAMISQPGRDMILAANSALALAMEAEDDFGLGKMVLQIRAGNGDVGSQWKDIQTWDVPTPGQRRKSVSASLPLSPLTLKVGDILLYRMVATDRKTPQPNTGISRVWSVTIAEADDSGSLLAAQAKRLLEALNQILALQRENRAAVDMDRAVDPIRPRQDQVRQLTLAAIDMERKNLRPTQSAIEELTSLADGPMLEAVQLVGRFGGTYEQRQPMKAPILQVMDQIIQRLEALIGKVSQAIASAEQAQSALEALSPEERDKALQGIRDMLAKLRSFMPEQDKVITDTQELVRKADDFTKDELQKIERLKGTEDKWAEVFTDSVKDITKLTEQGFADASIANDYKEMVEQIEEASKNLNPKLITMAVPRELSGRELAQSLAEEMEMWLPNSPDHIKWVMEEPLDFPEIPMVDLPDQLSDMIGDLIEDQDELNDAAEDVTSSWADSMSAAGWAVMDGPISNFSAVGKTGNQLPDNHELSGRAGEGRSGRSQGQMVENVAKGLGGRKTPTRITNDPYEKGVVKELQKMATGGATGGGKARGSGQEGLQGETPPPLMKDMAFMQDWQQRIRQKAERIAGQMKVLKISHGQLDKAVDLMKQAEQDGKDGRYADMFKKQQMVLGALKMAGDLSARDVALRVDRAQKLPETQRKEILDAMEEPVPQEYESAVRRYFLQLSEQ